MRGHMLLIALLRASFLDRSPRFERVLWTAHVLNLERQVVVAVDSLVKLIGGYVPLASFLLPDTSSAVSRRAALTDSPPSALVRSVRAVTTSPAVVQFVLIPRLNTTIANVRGAVSPPAAFELIVAVSLVLTETVSGYCDDYDSKNDDESRENRLVVKSTLIGGLPADSVLISSDVIRLFHHLREAHLIILNGFG